MADYSEKCPFCNRPINRNGTRYYITVDGIDRKEVCMMCYVHIEKMLLEGGDRHE